uniref:60S ribosomal protein L21 n=1 Tax=Pipistrellus kuhlii TaxID=59472 RepID=A0A7J7S558_PIPKU|nr:BTB domain containing 1 [Pipistrellus kuhlii]
MLHQPVPAGGEPLGLQWDQRSNQVGPARGSQWPWFHRLICQNANTKGERRGTRYMLSRPFRKHGIVPLATYMRTYEKGDIVDMKGMGAVHKGTPPNVTMATLEESTISPSMQWVLR